MGSSRRVCGLTLDKGDLLCWGRNNDEPRKPRAVMIQQAGPFAQISTSATHTCAIRVGRDEKESSKRDRAG